MCVQYIGRCSVHQRGWGVQYIGGIPGVHRGDIMSKSWDTISTSGGYHEYIVGCLVYRGDIMMHLGEQGYKSISMYIENPDVLMISLRCTEHLPMYSWYPPHASLYSSDVLNIPWCTEHTLYRVRTLTFSKEKIEFKTDITWSSSNNK